MRVERRDDGTQIMGAGQAQTADWRSRLRARLEESGKTRAQVCGEAGLNPAYLTQILEQKAATPRIDNLSKLAHVLDTTVCYLVDGVSLDSDYSEFATLFERLTKERKALAVKLLRDMAAASEDRVRVDDEARVENGAH